MARSSARRLLSVGLAGGAVAVGLVACNGIIGLDEFGKSECPGARCGEGGPPTDAPSDGPPTDAPDARVDASGTRPVVWARWVMPNYPDSGSGNDTTYSPTGAGALVDNTTKLVWMREIAPAAQTPLKLDAARAFCEDTKADGPWRLPSRIELVTLLDLSRSGAKIDPQFTGPQGTYWTASDVQQSTPRRLWAVDFAQGGLQTRDEANDTAFVRCVRSQ